MPFYTIAQISEAAGVTPSTLRYYENEGLLHHVERDAAGRRIFTDQDLEAIRLVCCLKNTGMSVHQIRDFISLNPLTPDTARSRMQILLRQREETLQRMEELRQNLTIVDKKIAYYSALCGGEKEKAPSALN